jgi:hypothetical protein
MARIQLRSRVDATRTHVAIELLMNDKPLGHILLEAPESKITFLSLLRTARDWPTKSRET